MIKKIFIMLVIAGVCLAPVSLQAYTLEETRVIYDKFYNNIEKKIKDDSKKIKTLEKLGSQLVAAEKKAKSAKTKELLKNLKTLNNKKIIILKSKIAITKAKQEEEKVLANTQVVETPKLDTSSPAFVQEMAKTYSYYVLNNAFEFAQNGETFRFNVTKYFKLSASEYQYFLNNKVPNGVVLKMANGQFVLASEYQKEKKYAYSELKKMFVNVLEGNKPYVLKDDGIYYGVSYQKYYFFDDKYGVYLSDLKNSSIDLQKTLFIDSLEGYRFTNDYKNIRIVQKSIIENLPNQDQFIQAVLDDNKYFVNNYDEVLTSIQQKTKNLTQGLTTDEEKIYAIHKYIVDSVEYYQNYSDGSKQIFSGILTYQNKSGVCDGYTKLMLYMLSFAGIQDVEIKKGFAYDNPDFPNFGHAWVRIGNEYYDPTFDDPIGGKDFDKKEFLYFKLPRELIYTNRFDGLDIPKNLESLTLEQRKQLVLDNMYALYEKYSSYRLMQKIKNRMDLGVDARTSVTLETLMNKMGVEEVRNFVLTQANGQTKRISSIRFYQATQQTIDVLLNDPKSDFSKFKILKWYEEDGTFAYKIAYEISYY